MAIEDDLLANDEHGATQRAAIEAIILANGRDLGCTCRPSLTWSRAPDGVIDLHVDHDGSCPMPTD